MDLQKARRSNISSKIFVDPPSCFHRICSHSGSLMLITSNQRAGQAYPSSLEDIHLVGLRRDSANAQVTATWENIITHSSV